MIIITSNIFNTLIFIDSIALKPIIFMHIIVQRLLNKINYQLT